MSNKLGMFAYWQIKPLRHKINPKFLWAKVDRVDRKFAPVWKSGLQSLARLG
jgi:hypothetical protein